jgi:hypothetical protein
MATKFYKKFEPNLGVSVNGTSVIKFITLDGIIGYFSTNDENLQNIFRQHIEGNRFGLSEISWTDFDGEYLKKKATAPPLKKPWREELSNQGQKLASTTSPTGDVASVAVVSEPPKPVQQQICGQMMAPEGDGSGVPSPEAVKAVADVAAALNVPFNPPVGKRTPKL